MAALFLLLLLLNIIIIEENFSISDVIQMRCVVAVKQFLFLYYFVKKESVISSFLC